MWRSLWVAFTTRYTLLRLLLLTTMTALAALWHTVALVVVCAARGGCAAQRFGGVGCARVERVERW